MGLSRRGQLPEMAEKLAFEGMSELQTSIVQSKSPRKSGSASLGFLLFLSGSFKTGREVHTTHDFHVVDFGCW